MKLSVTGPDFPENIFCPKNCENGPEMGQKLNLFYNENFFYLLCSCTNPIYLGKFLCLRYGPKCSQPIRLQDFLIISAEEISEIA